MEPQFEGQTKTKLGNSEVSGAVDKIVGEMLTNFLKKILTKQNKSFRKLFWLQKQDRLRKKPVKWFRENLRWEVLDFREII
jgi:DNA gyrase subunit B